MARDNIWDSGKNSWHAQKKSSENSTWQNETRSRGSPSSRASESENIIASSDTRSKQNTWWSRSVISAGILRRNNNVACSKKYDKPLCSTSWENILPLFSERLAMEKGISFYFFDLKLLIDFMVSLSSSLCRIWSRHWRWKTLKLSSSGSEYLSSWRWVGS